MGRRAIIISLFISMAVAGLAAAFASASPDGLEWVAEKLGFLRFAKESGIIASPLSDYHIKWLGESTFSTFIAGAIGTAAVFFMARLSGRLIEKKR